MNQSIIDVARGRFLGKHDVSPRRMGLQADRFSSDIRGFEGLLHKNKGNIKSVEPEIIKLHSKRASEFVYSDGY